MIGVMDNLQTSLLFRMLDLLLRVLTWGSAPKVQGESEGLKKRWQQVKLRSQALRQRLEQAATKVGHGWASGREDKSDEEPTYHAPFPQENLLTLSPQLVVKALTKAPLVDLLQIFSDCSLDEREHILSALRSAPLLGPPPKTDGFAPRFSKDPASLGCQGATLADAKMPEIPGIGRGPEHAYPSFQDTSAFRSEDPPASLRLSPREREQPPDSGWDDRNPFENLLRPQPKPMSDYESGMGIDREAFLKWVDADQDSTIPQPDEWLAPLPLFEDLPKTLPSRELRSFVMGRDSWTDDEELGDHGDSPPGSMPDEPEHAIDAPPQDPPPRDLRSLPPGLPLERTSVKTLRERPDDWDEFQPLYSELNMIRKRFRDPDPTLHPLHRTGASPKLDPDPGWLIKSGPPPGSGRDRYIPAWSSTGRGSPPGRYSSEGPPPVPLPRRGRRPSSTRSRNPRDSGHGTERQISGPG